MVETREFNAWFAFALCLLAGAYVLYVILTDSCSWIAENDRLEAEVKDLRRMLAATVSKLETLQAKVHEWMLACFRERITADVVA
ncbi:MAG: hypothetical protein AAGI24_12540 [Pseudomonadota bacterium]